jgi:hypothetical protein
MVKPFFHSKRVLLLIKQLLNERQELWSGRSDQKNLLTKKLKENER